MSRQTTNHEGWEAATCGVGAAHSLRRLVVAVLGGLLLLAAGSLCAADFTVDSTADTSDANHGDGVCDDGSGHCTLRAAIVEANSLAGSDTISVPAGTYSIGAPLSVISTISISGAGQDNTIIDGGHDGQVLGIYDPGNLSADNLTIRNGNRPGNQGGNILVGGTSTTLSLYSCTVSGGVAGTGGGIWIGQAKSVSLQLTTLTGNHATTDGGAIFAFEAPNLVLGLSTVTGNIADGNGGGVYLDGSTAEIAFTTFLGNQATGDTGGAIASSYSNLSLTDSTVRLNSAVNDGGGIAVFYYSDASVDRCALVDNAAGNSGGGLSVDVGTRSVDIANSTISGNTAATDGGGLYVKGSGRTSLSNCTVSDNTADADATAQPGDGDGGGIYAAANGVVLRNTVVAGNHDASAGTFAYYAPDCAVAQSRSIGSEGHDFIGYYNDLCALSGTQTDDQVGWYAAIDPGLGALTNSGYNTYYHPPLSLSPLIDMGDPAGCRDQAGALLTMDQRGEGRPYAATPCDIGAVESNLPGQYIFADGFESDDTAMWSTGTQ